MCRCVEKNLALQELQQQLAELTASHEAAVEEMKDVHCKEVETLKDTLSAEMAASAFDTVGDGQRHSAVDMVPLTRGGLYLNNSLDVRSLRELASLYHTKCQHAAFLQSKLSSVSEFIACIDSQPASENKSHVSTDDSCANVLEAVHTFALGFQQSMSDFPLQVENLQRLNRCSSSQRVQMAVRSCGNETHETSSSSEPPSHDCCVASNYQQVDSVVRGSIGTVDEKAVTAQSSDEVKQSCSVEEQLKNVNRRRLELQTAALVSAVAQLSQYKAKAESQASEISRLRQDIEHLQTKNETDISAEIADQGAHEENLCSVLQLELSAMKDRASQLQQQASSLQNDKDLLQEMAKQQAAELETKAKTIKTLDDKVLMLSSEVDSKSQQMEEKLFELESLNKSFEMCRMQLHAKMGETAAGWRRCGQSENHVEDVRTELPCLKGKIAALDTETDQLRGSQTSQDFEGILSERASGSPRECDVLTEELPGSCENNSQETGVVNELDLGTAKLDTVVELSSAEYTDVKQQLVMLATELETCQQQSEQTLQLLLTERVSHQCELHDKVSKLEESARETCQDSKRLNSEIYATAVEMKGCEVTRLKAAADSLKETLSLQRSELISALQRQDELIGLGEERHRSELAGVVERFEKKISDLEGEHYRTLEEHRERIAEMEQIDMELNTQLIAVTEKFNSVTEYTTDAERLIKDYQSKVDRLSTERQEFVIAAETTSGELLQRDAEIVALKEQVQLLKQPPFATPVANGETELAVVINNDDSQLHISLHGLESEMCSLNDTQHEDAELSLQQQQLTEPVESGHASLRGQPLGVIERLRCDHHAVIQHLKDDHNEKVVQLVKDFTAEMSAHDYELRETMKTDLGLSITVLL